MAMYQNRQMEWIHHSSSLQSMIKFISCYWTWIDLHIAWLALQMLLIIRQSRRSWMVSSIGSLVVFTVRCLYYTINLSPFLLMSFLACMIGIASLAVPILRLMWPCHLSFLSLTCESCYWIRVNGRRRVVSWFMRCGYIAQQFTRLENSQSNYNHTKINNLSYLN